MNSVNHVKSAYPLGVFDGADPASALRFAQFLLDLEPSIYSVIKCIETAKVQDFCWRFDHTHFDHTNHENVAHKDLFNDWLKSWQRGLPTETT